MDMEGLKRLAGEATPGPWTAQEEHESASFQGYWVDGPGAYLGMDNQDASDAAYIAKANPATVLALIAECERLKVERDEWHRLFDGAGLLAKNLASDRDQVRTQFQQELERHRTTWTQLEQAKRECEELREELGGIKNVGAETTDAMKRLVMYARTSGGTPGPDQGLMDACEQAERMLTIGGIGRAYMEGADAAMAKEAAHEDAK